MIWVIALVPVVILVAVVALLVAERAKWQDIADDQARRQRLVRELARRQERKP